MFDIFGMEKVNSREAVQEMMCGATRGLLEGYEYRLEEKQRKIEKLNTEITNLREEIETLNEQISLKKEEIVNLKAIKKSKK